MKIEHQIAQKLHGLSEPNSVRAHDLVDLQLIHQRCEINYIKLREICNQLFLYRQIQQWPPIITCNNNWESLYKEAAVDLEVITNIDAAIQWCNRFIDNIETS